MVPIRSLLVDIQRSRCGGVDFEVIGFLSCISADCMPSVKCILLSNLISPAPKLFRAIYVVDGVGKRGHNVHLLYYLSNHIMWVPLTIVSIG